MATKKTEKKGKDKDKNEVKAPEVAVTAANQMVYGVKEPAGCRRVGVIVAGGGLNMETAVAEAKANGLRVARYEGGALLYQQPKKK